MSLAFGWYVSVGTILDRESQTCEQIHVNEGAVVSTNYSELCYIQGFMIYVEKVSRFLTHSHSHSHTPYR